MRVPEMRMGEEYLSKGPSFLVWMHPALGPLWRVTRQKIQGGRLMKGAELALELAELALQDVVVDGSLLIHAEDVMGHMSEGPEPTLQYSDRCGRCRLVNVRVKNDGCDWCGSPTSPSITCTPSITPTSYHRTSSFDVEPYFDQVCIPLIEAR